MSAAALGIYLRLLRDGRHISQLDLAERLGVTDKALRTWEQTGRIKTEMLRKALAMLAGSWQDVDAILTADGDPTVLAQARLAGTAEPPDAAQLRQITENWDRYTPAQRELIARLATEMARGFSEGEG